MTTYFLLAAAIFFTFWMIRYLIHLNDLDLPLSVLAESYNDFMMLLLSSFWAFVIYCLNHPNFFLFAKLN